MLSSVWFPRSGNCRVHMAPAIRETIEKARSTLRYLPKYSPDPNPIEMPYSKFKTLLRNSPQECANYFGHAGMQYASI
jgi:transposase